MIRHLNSFIISIIFHTILIIAVFFSWKSYSSVKKEESDNKICLQLCNVVASKKVIEPKEVKKQETKKIEEIVKKEITKKEKIIPKEIVKKIEPKKTVVPLKKEVIEPINSIEEKPTKTVVEQDVHEETAVVQESKEVKQVFKKNVNEQEQNSEQKKQASSKEYLELNIQKITELLQRNLYYPRSARKRNITGEIIVKFTLGVDATAYNIEITKSNSVVLSRAAIKTIESLCGKFPKPQKEITLYVPISYDLKH